MDEDDDYGGGRYDDQDFLWIINKKYWMYIFKNKNFYYTLTLDYE